MSATRFLMAARTAAQTIQTVLGQRPGSDPTLICKWLLTEHQGRAWLFGVLDEQRLPSLAAYTRPEVLHHLSTALHGKPVLLSNSTGLRYAVLLSGKPALPQQVPFPGWRQGRLLLGENLGGQVSTSWPELGHLLAGGMTRSGKSNFLRLLAFQAVQEGFQLALADPDGRTFPVYNGHRQLLAPLGQTMEGCQRVMQSAVQEIAHRTGLYNNAPGFPDTLEAYNKTAKTPLLRLLVVVDEFNGLVQASGGLKSRIAQTAAQIAWRGLKFGVHLVLAGQTFEKAVVGPVRDQMTSRVCFRVSQTVTSRVVLGQSGAEKLTLPGRALTNRWGILQTCLAPRLEAGSSLSGTGLTEEEERLARQLLEQYSGRMTLKAVMACGVGERQARKLRKDWLARGLAETRPAQDNALCLRAEIRQRLENPSQPARASQPVQTVQTAS